MTLGKAIAEAIAGGIAGYATVATNKDFLSPLLSGMQAQQDRDARAKEKAGDREFAAEQGALDRKSRVDSQQSQQEFQAKLQFAEQQAVLMGDFSGYGKVMDELGVPEATVVANVAAAGGQFAEKADAKARDAWQANSKATIGAIRETLQKSPTDAINQLGPTRSRIVQHSQRAMDMASTDAARSIIAAETQAALSALGTIEEEAHTSNLVAQLRQGQTGGLAEAPLHRSQRALAGAGYDNDSVANANFTSVSAIRSQLDTLTEVNLGDVQHPGLRQLLSMFANPDNPPANTIIGQVGQDPTGAPKVLDLLGTVSAQDLQNEQQRLTRLNTARDFSSRLKVSMQGVAEREGLAFTVPDGAFIQDADGNMVLGGEGARRMAQEIEGKYMESGVENPTLSALNAVDQLSARFPMDAASTAAIKYSIAHDYEFQQNMALTFANPGETIGQEITGYAQVMSPKIVETIQQETAGMDTLGAKAWMQRNGFNPEDLKIVREGGGVFGKKIIRSLLPNSVDVGRFTAQLEGELTVAVAANDTATQQDLQRRIEVLSSVGDDPAVVSAAEDTLFSVTRAVAFGDLEGLYKSITEKAKDQSAFTLVDPSGAKNDALDEFVSYVEGGATEGRRVARALQWLGDRGAFQLGDRQQATSKGQQNFNTFLASYREDYGARLDDVIASMDIGSEFITSQPLLFGRADTEGRASLNHLMYLTSTGEEMANFTRTSKAVQFADYQRAQGLTN